MDDKLAFVANTVFRKKKIMVNNKVTFVSCGRQSPPWIRPWSGQAASTVFPVFVMTRPRIEPSPQAVVARDQPTVLLSRFLHIF